MVSSARSWNSGIGLVVDPSATSVAFGTATPLRRNQQAQVNVFVAATHGADDAMM